MKIHFYLILAALHMMPVLSQVNTSQANQSGVTFSVQTKSFDLDNEALVSARTDDLKRAAKIYGIDSDQHTWTRKRLSICPAFKKHLFVLYEQTNDPKVAFIAVYPTTGARIHLVVQRGGFTQQREPVAIQSSTIRSFNEIWAEERFDNSPKIKIADLSWASLAACYAELSGERLYLPPGATREDVVAPKSALEIHEPIRTVVFEVVSETGLNPSLSMNFDNSGFVKTVRETQPMQPLRIP